MRAIGYSLGLRGDLVMQTVAARSFKEQHPDCHLTLGIGPEFADMAPLFAQSPYYDDIHIYSTYEGWPNDKDRAYLKRAKYDFIFDGFPKHTSDDWWRYHHQYAESALMVGLPVPSDINPVLTKWFKLDKPLTNTVAFAPFAGFYSPNNDKRLSEEQAQSIVDYIRERGFKVIQLGGHDEPWLCGAIQHHCSYYDSVLLMLRCRALIHTDTGMGHIAGAYNHPSLGLYAARYYSLANVKNIQPRHSNFLSVESDTIQSLVMSDVYGKIDTLLS